MLDMTAPRYVPIKEGLLLICLVIIGILIVLYFIRLEGTGKKKDWNALISIVLAMSLIFTTFALATYEEPRYYFRQTYDLQIKLVNSSDGYSMNEFWIETSNDLASRFDYNNDNMSAINGLTPGAFETIEVFKNGTTLFDGNESIILKSVFRYDNFVLYYQNSTGDYTFFERSGNNYFDDYINLTFDNGQSYLEFNIWAYPGPE